MLWFLLRLALLCILFVIVRRLWIFLSEAVKSEGGLPPRPKIETETMVRDPECGLHLPPGDALTASIDDQRFYFCSRECRDTWLARMHGKKIEK